MQTNPAVEQSKIVRCWTEMLVRNFFTWCGVLVLRLRKLRTGWQRWYTTEAYDIRVSVNAGDCGVMQFSNVRRAALANEDEYELAYGLISADVRRHKSRPHRRLYYILSGLSRRGPDWATAKKSQPSFRGLRMKSRRTGGRTRFLIWLRTRCYFRIRIIISAIVRASWSAG